MKKIFSFVAATLFAATMMGQDDVETLPAVMDGTFRLDNNSVNYDLAATGHVELKRNDAGDFYGLLCFAVPEKKGYEVKSASLRLVSKMIKTDRTTAFFKLDADIAGKPAFADLKDHVDAALLTDTIGKVKAEGQNGKQVSSDEITSDKYLTIDKWQNNVNLEVAAVVPGENLSLLIAIPASAASKSDANRFFGKNATAFTNSKTAIENTADDLVPQLTVTYYKKEATAIDNTADEFKAEKLIIDGRVVIRRGNRFFDLTGREL